MINQDNKKKLIIFDSNAVIHRAYHALPPLTTKDGKLVGAVYGFLLVFLRVIKEFDPDFMVATFDTKKPTFRQEAFKEYKAKRPPTPDGIIQQIPTIREILTKFNVPIFEKDGFEADDIISTIALLVEEENYSDIEVIILTGDSDMLQLISDQTKVYLLRRGVKDIILYDKKLFQEKFLGLVPEQILDLKSLKGDASDNVPGVQGIGEKTATDLILEFGSLENLFKTLDRSPETEEIKERVRENLIKCRQQAFFAKKIIALEKHAPIDFSLEKCRWKQYSKEAVREILERLEFHSLIKKFFAEEKTEEKVGRNLNLW
ncbi:MAG: 5'-3' exonuclease H3TH domain-containing protein [Parcubacteria group bacterium]